MTRGRAVRFVGLVVGVMVVTLAGFMGRHAWLVTHPRVDIPGTSDVIVILGPSSPERIALGESMLDRGVAPQLVVSAHPADTHGVLPAPCRTPIDRRVTCFDPAPSTTQGEAQEIGRLGRERGWRSVQIITFRPQVERARLLVGRCFPGRATYLDAGEPYDAQRQLFYQTGAFAKAILTPGC